jgi:hypothetical protein
MPTISDFFGIRISLYWDDHNPPHFHAAYGEHEALVSIKEAVVIGGSLPNSQLKLVLAWAELYRDELGAAWDATARNEAPGRIPPLQKR